MSGTSYAGYWKIWLVLLALTLGMIFLDQVEGPRGLMILVLLAAMLVKATLIVGYFMHLRYESMVLKMAVVFGLFVNGAILFALIAPDAKRILAMTLGGSL